MSDDKDQNRGPAVPGAPNIEADEPGFDLTELDQLIKEEDPQFLEQISEIKITASSIDLSVMDQAFSEAAKPHISFFAELRAIFNYSRNPKKFWIFWSSVTTAFVLLILIWGVKKSIFQDKLFLTSFAEYGDKVQSYNPLTETEDFYDNPKFSKNLMTLSKMFVNLLPSENSGATPMLAIEINVQGISADAIIEIKDREAEFKDLLLRYMEERTYDDLITTSGKQNLCEQFRQIINSHLTLGQVRKVLLNSFIIKP
jgi:flagellar basal body-associated protein FliL